MSNAITNAQRLLPAASWSLAPALWAVNTELGQILPTTECNGSLSIWSLSVSSGFALLLAFALAIAAYRWRDSQEFVAKHERAETSSFIAYGGALLSVIFALAVLLQGMASLVL